MFEYRGVSIVDPRYRFEKSPEMSFYQEPVPRPDAGIMVTLTEWSAAAMGWVLAMAADVTGGNRSTFCARLSKL